MSTTIIQNLATSLGSHIWCNLPKTASPPTGSRCHLFAMNKSCAPCSKAGFHLIELLLILLILGIVAAVSILALATPKAKGQRIQCASNLKQVTTAFGQWSAAHEGQFSHRLSVTNGGALESALAGDVASVFRVMTKELVTPKILFCPTDQSRIQATTFEPVVISKRNADGIPFLSNTNISYFIGLDAGTNLPTAILAGDNNILVGGTNGIGPGFPALPVPAGILALTTNASILWGSDRHAKAGNVALVDGSVEFVSGLGLMRAVQATGLATNRLAMP